MAGEKNASGYVLNKHYSQADWDDVSDNPELTAEDFANARPLRETMPNLVEAVHRRGDREAGEAADRVSVHVDREIFEAYRSSGPGWQRRMNDALRKAVGLRSPSRVSD